MADSSNVCIPPNILTPETACHDGCPVLSKARHIIVPKGVQGVIAWPLRHPDGTSVNLSFCFPETPDQSVSESISHGADASEGVRTRFSDCDGANLMEIAGAPHDVTTGTVMFAVPQQVYDRAGIYRMSIAVIQEENGVERPAFIENALLSVENTLWGDTTQLTGPPTLDDLRIHLRDTAVENELLAQTEFDATEILNAIVRPIQQWNETPPPVAHFNCSTFPFKYHWMQGTVGQLLLTAAHSYMRNNLKVNHGGVSGNFKDKYKEYLQVAQAYITEWTEFITQKKVEINCNSSGSMPSAYYFQGY